MKIKRFFIVTFVAALFAMTISFGTSASANEIVVVTPTKERGFSAYTDAGGTVTFVQDAAAPSGNGALRLTTTDSVDSVAQYTKETNTPITSISEISYYSKQNIGSPEYAGANFALGIDLPATTEEYDAFLIYEPYLQTQPIVPGTFQFQDVDAGRLYVSNNLTCSGGTLTGGAGGSGPFYTLSQVQAICPEAVVNLFGVFIGTYNQNYDVEVDLINFNGTVYDFEPAGNGTTKPTTKDDCKNGGYTKYSNPTFKNQGQCIQYVNQLEKNKIRKN